MIVGRVVDYSLISSASRETYDMTRPRVFRVFRAASYIDCIVLAFAFMKDKFTAMIFSLSVPSEFVCL